MTTFFRTLERIADALMIALFGLIFALVLAQVVCRYGFDSPLTWSEELARLTFMWLGMLAWSLGSRRRSHIAVTVLTDRLPAEARLVLAIAVQGAIVVFCLLLAWHGTTLAARNVGLPSVTVPIDFAVVYAIVPVGAAMMILYALREIHDLVTRRRVDALTRDYLG
jgi:TRAP-type C4-dicarboxylate transport system permease small subunit